MDTSAQIMHDILSEYEPIYRRLSMTGAQFWEIIDTLSVDGRERDYDRLAEAVKEFVVRATGCRDVADTPKALLSEFQYAAISLTGRSGIDQKTAAVGFFGTPAESLGGERCRALAVLINRHRQMLVQHQLLGQGES